MARQGRLLTRRRGGPAAARSPRHQGLPPPRPQRTRCRSVPRGGNQGWNLEVGKMSADLPTPFRRHLPTPGETWPAPPHASRPAEAEADADARHGRPAPDAEARQGRPQSQRAHCRRAGPAVQHLVAVGGASGRREHQGSVPRCRCATWPARPRCRGETGPASPQAHASRSA